MRDIHSKFKAVYIQPIKKCVHNVLLLNKFCSDCILTKFSFLVFNIVKYNIIINVVVFYFQQFLFTDKTVKFLKDLIRRMHFKRVLCIGTPRYLTN